MSDRQGPYLQGAGRRALAKSLEEFLDDPDLLRLSLTHRSYCAEHPGSESNERLEFLGDAVLGLVVTNDLYRGLPHLSEGDLARIRADVVSAAALAPIARALGVGPALLLGRGEDSSGGREKPSLLADALEAIIGAVFIASGPESASRLVQRLTDSTIKKVSSRSVFGDPKNRLQELAAKRGEANPCYLLEELGPDHQKRFVAVVCMGAFKGRGEGRSKKEAEREAATAVLEELSFDDA